jgi:hypothetical protein
MSFAENVLRKLNGEIGSVKFRQIVMKARIHDLRIRNPLSKNNKPIDNKDLPQVNTGDYKPAYKNNPETAENQAQNLPDDLAEIIAIWPELPEHIKEAIEALVQTYKTTKEQE